MERRGEEEKRNVRTKRKEGERQRKDNGGTRKKRGREGQ